MKFNKNINLQPTQKLPKASKEVSVSEPTKTIHAIRVIRGQTKVSDCEPTKTIRAIRVIRGQTKVSDCEPTKTIREQTP